MSTAFQIPAYPKPLPISQARTILPPEEFRLRLRSHLQSHPGLTLAQVARQINVSRQCVSQIVGKLNRPNASSPLFMRLSPKTEAARQKLPELKAKVARGESAQSAAAKLGISLVQAYKLGFRAKEIHPPHGTGKRAEGCNCLRCRKAKGVVKTRNRMDAVKRGQILDWCAWSDPETGEGLSQAEIGKLAGVSQMAVSRTMRGASQ